MSTITSVLVLCTGNATRSVLAGELLRRARPDLSVMTAGTLSVAGLPIGWRTRRAFESIGVPVPEHRSTQAGSEHLEAADLVVGLAPEHVAWVRREHPVHASRTMSLVRLARFDVLHAGTGVAAWLRTGDAGVVPLEDWEEVVDPGGGDVEDFERCAREIADLIGRIPAVID